MNEALKMEQLIDEFIHQRSLLDKGPFRRHFKAYTPEFVALHSIKRCQHYNISGRVYLKELADKMEITIRQASKIAGVLKDKGLVRWAHDGDGGEGTYVEITERGETFIINQEERLKDYYKRVSEIYGIEKLMELLASLKQLEEIISRMPKEMGTNDV